MSLNRREMLRLGSAGAGGLLLSSAAFSNAIPSSLFARPLTPPAPAMPLAPAPAVPGGINPALFARAKAALDSHGGLVRHRDVIGIVDFSMDSGHQRFHVVDLRNGQVESHAVAHGRGSDPDHSGFVELFSNQFGSYASSNGTYITGDTYQGKYGT